MTRSQILMSVLAFATRIATAGTVVLNFDDLPVTICCVFVGEQVGEQYASRGVHFEFTDNGVAQGISSGGSGNWGLEGTNGSNFDSFNGRPGYSMTLTFDVPIMSFSMDFARANGSLTTNVFSIEGFSGSRTLPFGDVNEWQTVTLPDPVFYGILTSRSIIFRSSYGPNGLNGLFGVDNIRFQTPDPLPPVDTPEPASVVAVALGLGAWCGVRRRAGGGCGLP